MFRFPAIVRSQLTKASGNAWMAGCSRSFSGQMSDMGSGAGKGGGGGGSIRDAGGAFGKLEAAREEEYFYKLQKLQLNHLKKDLKDEVAYNEAQIKRFQEAIDRHKKRIGEISAEEKNLEKK